MTSVMSLVKVWTELDNGKCQSLPAKIVSKNGSVFKIRYLSSTENRDSKNRRIYRYEEETYEVTDDSITAYLDSNSELDLGFQELDSNGNFVKCEYDLGLFSDEDTDDEDYVPSSSSEEEDEDSEDDEDACLEDYPLEEDDDD